MKNLSALKYSEVYEYTKKNSKTCFESIANSLCEYYVRIWNNCSDKYFVNDLKKFTSSEKRYNRKTTKIYLDNLVKQCTLITKYPDNKEKPLKTIQDITKEFCSSTNLFHDRISTHYPYDFLKSTNSFVKKSLSFDKTLNINEITQALRNVWTMNLLQSLFGKKIELTPSIFSYSMLYPYTDNYLDSFGVSQTEKINSTSRLGYRIKGFPLISLSNHEEKIYSLISNIEVQYPRLYNYPLYESLFYINKFQLHSLTQQETNVKISYKKALEITVSKGGLSVLTDAYLVKETLEIDEIIFVYGLGFMLQLLDDFQDIVSDLKFHNITLFTINSESNYLQNTFNKLINFILFLLSHIEGFNNPFKVEIKNALLSNSILLLLFSCSRNNKFFTKEYIKELEQFYPFPASYMKNFNKTLRKVYNRINKLSNSNLINDILSISPNS